MRFIVTLLVLTLVGTIIIYSFPRTWELDLIAGLQNQSNPVAVSILQMITDYVDLISVGIPVTLLIIGFVRANRSLREKAFLILLSVGLAGLLSNGLKRIVREPRPYEVDTRITQWSGGGGYGFPSGHTSDAVAAATAFSLLWWELPVVAAVFAWALVIMFSRVFLGVHDPGDVMAGMFLGLLSGVAVIKIRDAIKRQPETGS